MFCAMCQDTRQKNEFTRGSRNYQATAVFEHSISQANTKAVASEANQPSMKGHFDAACAKENDCILAQLPPFFSLGGGKGSLPMLIVVLPVLCTALHVERPRFHHHTESQKS